MRKAIILIVLAGLVGCKSGDEAPEEQNPLVSLLGLTSLQSYGWSGTLTNQTCAAENIVNTVINCEIYSALEAETLSYVSNNGTVIFQTPTPNRIAGVFTFVLPNYNLNPLNTYQVVANSMTMEQGYDTGSGAVQIIRLSAGATATSVNNTQLELLEFSATQDPRNLPGTLKVRLSQPSNPSAGAIVVTYGFNFSKLF